MISSMITAGAACSGQRIGEILISKISCCCLSFFIPLKMNKALISALVPYRNIRIKMTMEFSQNINNRKLYLAHLMINSKPQQIKIR